MNKSVRNEKIISILGLIVIVLLFILFSYITRRNIFGINDYLSNGIGGMFLYVFIIIVAVVIAPVSATPLLPIASNSWGWIFAGVLSIIGWSIGATIAFSLARKYGIWMISRWVNLGKLHRIEKLIPKRNLFLSVVFLRMALPVDILSYALGLFSKMSLRSYILATIIGITPFAFILAYLGSVTLIIQLTFLFIGVVVLFVGYSMAIKKLKNIS